MLKSWKKWTKSILFIGKNAKLQIKMRISECDGIWNLHSHRIRINANCQKFSHRTLIRIRIALVPALFRIYNKLLCSSHSSKSNRPGNSLQTWSTSNHMYIIMNSFPYISYWSNFGYKNSKSFLSRFTTNLVPWIDAYSMQSYVYEITAFTE